MDAVRIKDETDSSIRGVFIGVLTANWTRGMQLQTPVRDCIRGLRSVLPGVPTVVGFLFICVWHFDGHLHSPPNGDVWNFSGGNHCGWSAATKSQIEQPFRWLLQSRIVMLIERQTHLVHSGTVVHGDGSHRDTAG